MDAFDADVLIYAAAPGHPLGRRVAALFEIADELPEGGAIGIGSVLLLPETLTHPLQDDRDDEVSALAFFLARLDLRPVDRATADLAVVVGARYGLRAADALHLATAIIVGADRFITNNRRDFDRSEIGEVAITYPDQLP